MNLEVEVSPRPGLSAVTGPHELSWSYILDAVFADACQQRLGALRVVLPTASLERHVSLRRELAAVGDDRHSSGLALLAGPGAVGPITADRLYLLDQRRVYLPARHAALPGHGAWRLEWSIDVMSLRSRLLGLAIRAALLAGRSDLADRASFLMRRHFASERPTPSRYRLTAWANARSGATGA